MSKDIPGGEAFDGREPVDPLAPVTRGRESIADHHRFWRTAGNERNNTVEVRDVAHRLVGQVVILDLPEQMAVDPDLRASIHPYPPMRSEVPLPGLGEVLDLIHSIYGQRDNPNPA